MHLVVACVLRFEDDRLRLRGLEAQGNLLEQREERAGRMKERAKRIAAERQRDQALKEAETEALARREAEAKVAELMAQLRRQS